MGKDSKEKELELVLVTSDRAKSSDCGPDTCPWVDCPGR